MKKKSLEEMRSTWQSVYANRTRCSEEAARAAFDREADYFEKQTEEKKELQNCTEVSLKNAFLDIAATGLSIQTGPKAEAFLEKRGAKKTEANGAVTWTNVCSLKVTAYGELNMRIMAGQIVRASNPVIIYECDKFQPHTNERGDLVVDYKPAIPRVSTNIIGCYVQLILPHDGRDYKWLLLDDIARLKGYSAKQNKSSGANELYTANGGQIDPGFLEAKTLKHAMRAYTKMHLPDSVKMDDEEEDTPEQQAGFAEPAEEQPEGVQISGDEEGEEDIF